MGPTSGGEGTSRQARSGLKISFKAKSRESSNFTPSQVKKLKIDMGSSISTSNSYVINNKPLSDFQMDTTTLSSSNTSNNQQQNNSAKVIKNPPIIITNTKISTVQDLCNKIIKSKKFELRLLYKLFKKMNLILCVNILPSMHINTSRITQLIQDQEK